jgi:hypothetical protein
MLNRLKRAISHRSNSLIEMASCERSGASRGLDSKLPTDLSAAMQAVRILKRDRESTYCRGQDGATLVSESGPQITCTDRDSCVHVLRRVCSRNHLQVDACGSQQTAGTSNYNPSVEGLHPGTFRTVTLALNIVDKGMENLSGCATTPTRPKRRSELQARPHRVSSASKNLILGELMWYDHLLHCSVQHRCTIEDHGRHTRLFKRIAADLNAPFLDLRFTPVQKSVIFIDNEANVA